jgi:rhamnose utilization protein RhaD (predicted bifunctional aldolase and dehydrogenase)/NAD(P)-dependent dehydrogenase (short-subunit alcohol dehydrogenase family)
MHNKWNKSDADRTLAEFDSTVGSDLALCIYISRLIGKEPDLVLHGGGNTSVKTTTPDVLGQPESTLFVKASGYDLSNIPPGGFSGIRLDPLKKTRALEKLPDNDMIRELRKYLQNPDSSMPSIEAFLHAFIPSKFIVHTHPAAILALTNQQNPEARVSEALGSKVSTVPYIRAGFGLAKLAAEAFDRQPKAGGMVLLQHGLVTWGESAEEAYASTIGLVGKAEKWWQERRNATEVATTNIDTNDAWKRYVQIAPLLRGLLAEPSGEQDHPFRRFILLPWITSEALEMIAAPDTAKLALSSPLTPDHLIRTKSMPLLISDPNYEDLAKLKEQIQSGLQAYVKNYQNYFERHAQRLDSGVRRLDPLPRVLLLPGIGVVCAGETEKAALIARDITAQSITVKRWFAQSGIPYHGLEEDHLFDMEYFLMQQAKLGTQDLPLRRHVAIVTGAAGAIGMGITEALLQNGCHVAITDLAGANLDKSAGELKKRFPNQVYATGMDVTDPQSVEHGFREVIRQWGGIDLVIVNAGIAMVSSLAEMDLDGFRRLEKVNVEGTLLVIREAARLFQLQGTGGDVILISTRNVFAPGAKFGAYSATKAAAHQLARIASLELADLGVRVNMVAPDAVFSHGQVNSGLWAEVGPDRMKSRGLDQAGLEDYYRNRNLLKAKITAEHVARAVLFFATRQTPTTGATLPVDGGLPDSTPR